MADDDDFEELSTRFIDWLKQNGTTISSKIEIADLRHRSAGRGVIAKVDIDVDEELFSIPRASILAVDTSNLHESIKYTLDDPWLSLILVMVYEYLQGTESRWKAYFDVLPDEFDTLMYWAEEELELLQGSAVLNKIGRTGADRSFVDNVIPIIRQHAATFNAAELSDDDLLHLCHRMGSIIMAYAFDLENSSESKTAEDGWEEDSDGDEISPKGMVPLADTLNADADRNNAKLFYEEDKVVMKAIKPIKRGEELFNDYGPLPRADVLRRYGYITDIYAKYDVVEVSLEMIKETAKEELKMEEKDIEARTEYLDEQGVVDDGYDISRASSADGQFSEELRILLNTLVLPTADFDKLKKKEKLPKPDLSKDALQLLYGVLVRRRSMYPPDKKPPKASAALNSMGSQNGNSALSKAERRCMMASQVIAGEKYVLQEAAETVQELISDGKKRKADDFESEAMQLQSKKRKEEEAS